MQEVDLIKAVANERRLQVLDWLKEARLHFRPQADGDLVKDGVCAVLLAEKLGISQASLSEHMRVLCQAGLVRSKRVQQWIFYQRNEKRIGTLKTLIRERL